MTKAELHRLIDELPEGSVDSVGRLLERALDPMIAVLDAAPLDDEPYTEEDRQQVEAAAARVHGEGIPLEQLIAEDAD